MVGICDLKAKLNSKIMSCLRLTVHLSMMHFVILFFVFSSNSWKIVKNVFLGGKGPQLREKSASES